MKPILILQNCETEREAGIGDVLNESEREFTVHQSFQDSVYPSLSDFDAVIALGTFHSVHDRASSVFLERLYHYVASVIRSNKPLLGICFGSQLLAHVLGAQVEQSPVKEIGASSVTLTDDGIADPLFKGIDSKLEVFQWHGETFRVPFGGKLLATGEQVKNQAFRVGNAVGLQFHCELKEEDLIRWSETYGDELKNEEINHEDLLNQLARISSSLTQINKQIIKNFLNS